MKETNYSEKIIVLGIEQKVLPNFPNAYYLDCSFNKIKKLPEIKKVTILICSNNKITKIPQLSTLYKLICNNNNIKRIPKLVNLEIINCSYNKLRIIPELPKIEEHNYSHNRIKSVKFTGLCCFYLNINYANFYGNKIKDRSYMGFHSRFNNNKYLIFLNASQY